MPEVAIGQHCPPRAVGVTKAQASPLAASSYADLMYEWMIRWTKGFGGRAKANGRRDLQALLFRLGRTLRLLRRWTVPDEDGRQGQGQHRPFHSALKGWSEQQEQSRAVLLPLQSRQGRHRPARDESMGPRRTAACRDRRFAAHQSRAAQTAYSRTGETSRRLGHDRGNPCQGAFLERHLIRRIGAETAGDAVDMVIDRLREFQVAVHGIADRLRLVRRDAAVIPGQQ